MVVTFMKTVQKSERASAAATFLEKKDIINQLNVTLMEPVRHYVKFLSFKEKPVIFSPMFSVICFQVVGVESRNYLSLFSPVFLSPFFLEGRQRRARNEGLCD